MTFTFLLESYLPVILKLKQVPGCPQPNSQKIFCVCPRHKCWIITKIFRMRHWPTNHSFTKCSKFLQMSISQRRASVLASNCYNCLGYGHRKYKCLLLHQDSTIEDSVKNSVENQPTQKSSAPSITVCTTHVGGRVLMATVLVTLVSESAYLTVRALLDPAAEESFITEHIAQALRLKKQPVSTTVTGIGGEVSTLPTYEVTLNLQSNTDPDFITNFYALVLKKLTNFLSNKQVQCQNWPHI